MRRYIEHMHSKEPHERRQHAVRMAGVITGGLFVLWLGTFSVRLAPQLQVAQEGDPSLTAAAAASMLQNQARLEVSTTSVFTGGAQY